MGCCRVVFAAVLAVFGCTKSNPAFDADERGETRGDDDGGEDDPSSATQDEAESEAGSIEGSDGEPETGSEEGETTIGMVESSGGSFECAEVVDYDWAVALTSGDVPVELDCAIPYELIGIVESAADDVLAITPCDGCACDGTEVPVQVDAPGLLPPVFDPGSCARVDIEWSAFDRCRPVGFVASTIAGGTLRTVSVAGQDVKTLPEAVGAMELVFDTTEPCECDDCCVDTGIASVGFNGVHIREGEADDVAELLGNSDVWHVEVHEAHVDAECNPALSWSAVPGA